MPKYIDVEKISIPKGFFETVDTVPKLLEWLNNQPATDVEEVRHGYWEKIGRETVRCSACGSFTSVSGLLGTSNSRIIGVINPRCRICGAKMDGGKS